MTETFYKIIDLVQKDQVLVSSHGYDEMAEENMKRHQTKLVNEGRYVAEVDIELIDMKEGWSPYLSLDDAKKT